ncbi:MAG: zinc metallopeptidase, partial [Planctomycetota bacterium]|nr:zinc metallopeptidase [Planctomycetota bacterium]
MFGFFFDPFWMLVTLIGGGLTLWAQMRVKSTFGKYSQVGVRSGMTGAQAARAVCRAGGVEEVAIERHGGFLSDHYNPKTRTLALSPDVHDGRSVSSIAVAAHEAGHAIQHASNYGPLGLRSSLVPMAGIGSRLWYLPFFLGIVLNMQPLIQLAVLLFSGVVLFQLVTLPVEFDASKRAKAVLTSSGIVSTADEARGVEQVLGAAAMTYVAAV